MKGTLSGKKAISLITILHMHLAYKIAKIRRQPKKILNSSDIEVDLTAEMRVFVLITTRLAALVLSFTSFSVKYW